MQVLYILQKTYQILCSIFAMLMMHLSEKNGGPPLSLKSYAAQYIDYKAKDHERLLASERSQKAKDYNLRLKFRLKK